MQRDNLMLSLKKYDDDIKFLNELETVVNNRIFTNEIKKQIGNNLDQCLTIATGLGIVLDIQNIAQLIKSGKMNGVLVTPFCLLMKLYAHGYAHFKAPYVTSDDSNFLSHLTIAEKLQISQLKKQCNINTNISIDLLKKQILSDRKKYQEAVDKIIAFCDGKYSKQSVLFNFFNNGGMDIVRNKIFPLCIEELNNKHLSFNKN